MSTSTIDVLVVGAGPTGLTMASELARHGSRPRIIDRAPAPATESRAFGVHARTMELFDTIGAIEPLLARGTPVQSVSVYNRGSRMACIDLHGKIDSKYPFILILPQSDTERVLTDHLASFRVRVDRSTTLEGLAQDDGGVTAHLRLPDGGAESVRCRYLIGCDGAHSVVRKGVDIPFEGAAYPNQWLLADMRLDWELDHDDLAVFTHPRGVSAYFPLAEQRSRFMFQLPDTGLDDELGEPTLDHVRRLLTEREVPFREVRDPTWLAYFRLHHRLAARFRAGRVFLAGDAGHIHSPVGGQGMNIGIQDAFNLAWKLALVLRGHAPGTLLDSYEVERRRVDRGVVDLTHRATTLVGARNPVLRAVRSAVIKVASKLDSVQHRLLTTISQIEHHYRGSPIVAESWKMSRNVEGFRPPEDALAPGERVADFALEHARTGEATSLYELLTGAEHELLLFTGLHPGAEELARLRSIVERVEARYPELIEVHLIQVPGSSSVGLPEVASHHIDGDHRMHLAFGASCASVYLVRPDGYVGFRNQPASLADLQDYLDTIFRREAG